MGIYAGNTAAWIDNVYTFEETDVVQGGVDGIDNVPIKNLSDRTAWLKDRIGRFTDDVVIAANIAIDNTYTGKLISAVAAGILTLTLDNAANFKSGAIISFSSFCGANSVVYIQAAAGEKFYDSGAGRSTMYMHDREHLFIIASAGGWKILNAIGNFYCVGEEVKSRRVLRNTFAFTGQLLQRSLYPRALEYIQSLPAESIVSEELWLSDPINYRGFFTMGDGISDFRVPDERSMSDRMLDLGRGIDLSRNSNAAGGYGADQVGSHTHPVPIPKGNTSQTDVGQGRIVTGSDGNEPYDAVTLTAITNKIGAENTVKNIGKYNLMKY